MPQQQIPSHEQEEHHGDDSIHREESGVEFGEIVRGDQGVLVKKK
jgi:hypothetical protein